MVQQLDGPTEVTNFISDLNNKYEKVSSAQQQQMCAELVCILSHSCLCEVHCFHNGIVMHHAD